MIRWRKQKMRGGRRSSTHWVAVAASTLALTGCEQDEAPRNAAQQSSIDNAMEEVEAAQVRSDINVAEVKASEDLERQEARERQRSAEKSAE